MTTAESTQMKIDMINNLFLEVKSELNEEKKRLEDMKDNMAKIGTISATLTARLLGFKNPKSLYHVLDSLKEKGWLLNGYDFIEVNQLANLKKGKKWEDIPYKNGYKKTGS